MTSNSIEFSEMTRPYSFQLNNIYGMCVHAYDMCVCMVCVCILYAYTHLYDICACIFMVCVHACMWYACTMYMVCVYVYHMHIHM